MSCYPCLDKCSECQTGGWRGAATAADWLTLARYVETLKLLDKRISDELLNSLLSKGNVNTGRICWSCWIFGAKTTSFLLRYYQSRVIVMPWPPAARSAVKRWPVLHCRYVIKTHSNLWKMREKIGSDLFLTPKVRTTAYLLVISRLKSLSDVVNKTTVLRQFNGSGICWLNWRANLRSRQSIKNWLHGSCGHEILLTYGNSEFQPYRDHII